MTHVFIAPHPDDAALSCGGLIAGLRELGQAVTILTVYSGGPRSGASLVDAQREVLGFGNKTVWPNTQAFDRGNIGAEYPVPTVATATAPWAADANRIEATQAYANTQARQFWQRAAWTRSANITNDAHADRPIADGVPTQGTLARTILDAQDTALMRRAEDERYAYFVEASIVDLDLPDAIHRGYEGDDALLGPPADDDEPPVELLRREILRLEPQQVYAPLAVGGHVDHRLCRAAVVALLDEPRSWVMPAPELSGRVSFYEDFPYAWWNGFTGLTDLDGLELDLPDGLRLEPRYADISDQLERKSAGIRLYASQVGRLFDGEQGLLDDVAGYAARVAQAGRVGSGAAERYWGVVRA